MQLVADNLHVARGARAIFSGVSLAVASGEALLVVGPNGAGKTTLIRTIAGFIQTVAGTIELKGEFLDRDVAEHCHYVGHLTGVKSALTAEENLAFWAAYLGGDRATAADRIDAALSAFGLEALASYPAGLLSAGQKRRLGLARLLIAKRPVWLLDEPTVSLDAKSTDLLAGHIKQHLAGGGLVIAATHLPLGLDQPRYLRLGRSDDKGEWAAVGEAP